jgi:hypothetical protein
MLGAFQNNLNPVSFLCHCIKFKNLGGERFSGAGSNMLSASPHFLYNGRQTFLVNGAECFRRNLQSDPTIFFLKIESFGLQIR